MHDSGEGKAGMSDEIRQRLDQIETILNELMRGQKDILALLRETQAASSEKRIIRQSEVVQSLPVTSAAPPLEGIPSSGVSESKPEKNLPTEPVPPSSQKASTKRVIFVDNLEIPQSEFQQPRDLFKALFQYAVDPDEERGFRHFAGLFHSDITSGSHSLAQLRSFVWRQLRKKVGMYLKDMNPESFTFIRTVPDEPTAEDDHIKFFIYSPARSPVPVTLARDREYNNAWRVIFCSL
jgi:hypothetical protein